ncbi:divergent polysaccharide deacetylase family protein [Gilvimarinus algae]|uniref:Divergent polysaccharide deacetylase family protein n=1 Tax=Gilvimarinus algae TaxID=3058037 RepID=A0ABT8TB29_9GAMM|nr:divergent polysaccharide deacetylase family protein [Gilvimarinus sp. SDUM040014]MDO3381314.1 divergent polysaccharide deacetylase family protein [Gilvimarinus sp. SDUM040014]
MPRRLLCVALLCLSLGAQAKSSAKLAIIIDDIGYNLTQGKRSAMLQGAYTLAILPSTPHGPTLARLGRDSGKELILHTPMANIAGLPLGPGGLENGMSRADTLAVLRASLDELPGITGLNNHTGSALTTQARPMGWVMGEAARRKLFFIDSRTTASSLALDVAQAYGLKSAKRDVFLDHSRKPADIRHQLERAIRIAKREGQAIAIGHPYPETLELLEQAADWFELEGIELVPASEVASHSPPSSSFCPAPPQMLRSLLIAAVPPRLHRWWSPLQLIENGYQALFSVYKDDINNPG